MRCLITGADGFLGANLARRLLADGYEVTGAALNRKGLTSLDALGVEIRLEYGDVTDAAYIDRLINAYEPDVIFHLAAVSIVRVADANPGRALRTNILGTLNVVEAAQRYAHVKRVLVASSDKAYGHQRGDCREDMPLKPTGAYEVSKASADMIARLYGAVVVRCANLFGPADLNWSRLIPNSCRLALDGKPPMVYEGAWDIQREWLDVDSAVNAYLLLASEGIPGEAYNIGSGETITAGDMAQAVARIIGGPDAVSGERAGWYEIPTQKLCSDKIRSLGWTPRRTLVKALEFTVNWYARYLGRARIQEYRSDTNTITAEPLIGVKAL